MNLSTLNLRILQLEQEKINPNSSLNDKSESFNRDNLNITSIQALFLQDLIKTLNPKHILEFGTSNGYSLLSMIKGVAHTSDFNEKTFTSVEVDIHQYKKAEEIFLSLQEEFEKNQVILHHNNIFNKELLTSLQHKKYDVIFVDCMQSEYDKVLQYIIKNNLLSKTGAIIFENIISHEKSFEFYENLKENESKTYNIEFFPIHNGFLIVKQK